MSDQAMMEWVKREIKWASALVARYKVETDSDRLRAHYEGMVDAYEHVMIELGGEILKPAADAAGKMAEPVAKPQPPAPQTKAATTEAPENVFLFHSKVVGTTFRNDKNPIPWDQLSKGKNLCLLREKDNPADKNAIKVLYVPHHLGYLPKQTAAELAPKIDSGSHYFAEITEITGGTDKKENRGINISVFLEA